MTIKQHFPPFPFLKKGRELTHDHIQTLVGPEYEVLAAEFIMKSGQVDQYKDNTTRFCFIEHTLKNDKLMNDVGHLQKW